MTAELLDAEWPRCDHCRTSAARWSVAHVEDGDANHPIVSAFACRRHLSYVLEYHWDAMRGMDQAVVIDLLAETVGPDD